MLEKSSAATVVIGGGIAGMVAAVRLVELGKQAVVLEQGKEELYPCNTRYTGGTFHVAFTDPLSDRERLAARINEVSQGFARPDLVDVLADGSGRLHRWLRDKGIKFINLGGYQTCILAPPSRTGPGLEWKGRGGDVLLRTLEAELNKRGGRVVRGARARQLKAAEGGGIEVLVERNGEVRSMLAGDVVIADGGFQANAELVSKHINPAFDRIKQRGAANGRGDGLAMVQKMGGAITGGLDCFYGHLLSRDAMHSDRLWPRPYMDALAVSGIVVDAEGNRIADEGNGGNYMANAVARLPDPLSASVVFDHAIWCGPGAKSIIPANPHLINAGGTIYKASSLAEVAAMAGLNPDVLTKVVNNYNEALATGRAMEMTPPRRADRHQPYPIEQPPFYVVPVCSGITYTMGGIAINGDCAVLDRQGNPIPHLYAAGCTTGGLEGGPMIGYIGGLNKAGVTGMRAAEAIAAHQR